MNNEGIQVQNKTTEITLVLDVKQTNHLFFSLIIRKNQVVSPKAKILFLCSIISESQKIMSTDFPSIQRWNINAFNQLSKIVVL